MQLSIKRLLACSFLVICQMAVPWQPKLVFAVQWELLPEQCHDVELTSATDAAIQIRTIGGDPFLVGRLVGIFADDTEVLSFEYFCPSGIESPSAFFGPPFSAKTNVDLPSMGIAEGWQSYNADLSTLIARDVLSKATQLRIDLGNLANVRLQIRDVRLRPKTASEKEMDASRERVRQEKLAAAQKCRSYLRSDFSATLQSISITKDKVQIRGTVPSEIGSMRLHEFPPECSLTEPSVAVDATFETASGSVQIDLPRYQEGRDRLYSAWQIQDANGQPISPRRFVTSIAVESDDFANKRPNPRNLKGLTSVGERGPMDELPELGISAVTINLVLTRFVTDHPGQNRVRIDAPGPPIYFDRAAFASYDRTIDFARKHDIVVSAVVLIPSPRDGDASAHPLVHPENDGGVYAMPDLTTRRGATIYAYVLNEIAKRYRNHERSPGAITNWIAHNEIDFHPDWTNMGDQPRPLVTETYYRSMRMIHNAAKQHNPHARVFVSLTHHWVVPDDGSQQHSWQQLAPREMIETLQRYSNLEGDFDWGVAYHPYPQSLFAKVAWNDTKVTNDFDTPLITIQNLEVLGEFLKQPGMLASTGQVRSILLSEQGFHTDSYDDESQDRQAASLWYAMQKVRRLPMVESFHYHRWIDHPDEGGLMLGLRTLPTADQKYGTRKKSWFLYQALGTDREAEVTQDLPRP